MDYETYVLSETRKKFFWRNPKQKLGRTTDDSTTHCSPLISYKYGLIPFYIFTSFLMIYT